MFKRKINKREGVKCQYGEFRWPGKASLRWDFGSRHERNSDGARGHLAEHSGKANSKSKGPELGVCSTYLRNSKEAALLRAD